jgi:hypothetical protein
MGEHLNTVAEVEAFFAKMCFEIDQRLGERAAVRWFLNFWDETPRQEMLLNLSAEINLEQLRRRERQEEAVVS